MELHHTFRVNVPVEEAWAVMTDAERVAPCVPGAKLVGAEGNDYLGRMKIKIGPIRAEFNGTVRYDEQDVEARRVVLDARGKDAKGLGNASARIVVDLSAVEGGSATGIDVRTDLDISGRVAQFGRRSLEDVSERMIGQFADSLETLLTAPPSDSAQPRGSTDAGSKPAALRTVSRDASENYFDASPSIDTRVVVAAGAAAAFLALTILALRIRGLGQTLD